MDSKSNGFEMITVVDILKESSTVFFAFSIVSCNTEGFRQIMHFSGYSLFCVGSLYMIVALGRASSPQTK